MQIWFHNCSRSRLNNEYSDEVYLIQHYVIKFVSDLRFFRSHKSSHDISVKGMVATYQNRQRLIVLQFVLCIFSIYETQVFQGLTEFCVCSVLSWFYELFYNTCLNAALFVVSRWSGSQFVVKVKVLELFLRIIVLSFQTICYCCSCSGKSGFDFQQFGSQLYSFSNSVKTDMYIFCPNKCSKFQWQYK